jgi:hypothetical protein
MIFLLLFNGFFVSVLQGARDIDYYIGGVRKSEVDPRTIPWIKEAKIEVPLDLPASVDHSANMPPVRDKGSQGACVAWAFGYYYKTYQEWQEHNWDVADSTHQFSPAFIYNLANKGEDAGIYESEACIILEDLGCATLDICPYDSNDYLTWPTEEAFESAIPYRCESSPMIFVLEDGIDPLKAHIASGDNALTGVKVCNNLIDIDSFDNIFCLSDVDSFYGAWHEICLVGYDDNLVTNDGTGAFKFVNCWGTEWGDNGYAWVSYETTLDQCLFVYYFEDKNDYSPTLLTRFKIDHPAREGIRFRFMIDGPENPSWEKPFFNWVNLEDPLHYDYLHPFPDHNIVFDLSDGESFFDWQDTIYMIIYDSLPADGITGELEYLEADYNYNSYTAFDAPETRSIPDGGEVIVPLYTTSWTKSYGASGWDKGRSVAQADDNGYVTAGATNSFGFGLADVLLFKTDDGGNVVEWTQVYGGSRDDEADCVKRSTDGGYALAGYTCSYSDTTGDVYLIKTDSMGVMEWYKTFGSVGARDWAKSIDQCTDGGYIICGGRNYSPPDHYLSDGWLIKTDSLGNVEWDRTIAADTADYQFQSVQQTDDGGYIVVAIVTSEEAFGGGYSDYDMFIHERGGAIAKKPLTEYNWTYLLKTDSLGNTEWVTTYTDTALWCYSVQQTSDGGYILGGDGYGYIPGYAYLLKVNSTGGLEWQRLFGIPWASGYSALETSDHGFVLAGYTDYMFSSNTGDAYLVKTDQLGNLEWELISDIPVTDVAYDCQETSDYGFILAGYTFSNNGDILIIKTPAGEGPSGIPIQELPPEVISADTSIVSIYSSTPNPFFNEVNISYSLRKKCDVEISVHNIIGQKVKDFGREEKSSGMHTNSWNGLDNHGEELPSGIYFFRIEAGNEQAIRKLVLVR